MNSPPCQGGSHILANNMTKGQLKKAQAGPSRVKLMRRSGVSQRAPGYKTVSPPLAVAVNSKNIPAKSRSVPSGDGRILVSHREYITDVIGSDLFGTFTASFAVNPGVSTTFPWLHHMAYQYEAYRFRSLRFEFCPSLPSTTPGRVFMFLDYDAADVIPGTKQAFLSNHGAVSTSAWCPIEIRADEKDLHKLPQHINRYGDLAANLDIKTYDVANLFVASQGLGVSGGSPIGELYVTYELEFITPQLNYRAEIEADSSRVIGGGVISKLAPFGTAPTKTGGLPITVDGTSVTFRETGEYLMDLEKVGTGLVNTVLTGNGFTSYIIDYVLNAASTKIIEQIRFKVDNVGAQATFGCAGDTTVTASALRFAQYLYSLA